MLGSNLNANDSPITKKYYRAVRHSELKTQKIEEIKEKPKTVRSEFSPTPKKIDFPSKTELSDEQPTQELYPDKDLQVYGKRKPEFEVVNRLKYFKRSDSKVIGQNVICFYDPEVERIEYFDVFREDEIIESEVDLKIEQISEDYATSLTQIVRCKEFLEKELENAILNA